MKVYLMITEDWKEIEDGIKEAEQYLSPLGVVFSVKQVIFDARREEYYDIKTSNSRLEKRLTKSIKGEVVRAIGISHAGTGFDYYGLIVDKAKSLETYSLAGQHSEVHKTIEIYATKSKKKYHGLSYIANNIVHEVFHALADQKGLPDNLHKYLDTKPKTLDAYRDYLLDKKTMTYKYFKPKEVQGLKPELVAMLDMARGLAGIPFVINSGLRTKEKNSAVGGVEDSAHLYGEAVDLRARDGKEKFLIVQALIAAGFKRIGISWKDNFVHCDISKTKPSPTIYTY